MSDISGAMNRFSAAASRFVKAAAPVAALFVQQSRKEDPSSSTTPEDVVKMYLTSFIHHFMTTDGNISVAEGLVVDAVMQISVTAATAEALGGIKSGQLYELIAEMGSNAEASATSAVRLLKVASGPDAVEEYINAAMDLATAVCDLDGRSSGEDQAIANFGSALHAAASG